ncbi:MAG TPA: GNAT family N-acetyltransferase [Acidimicrobiales bacterium]|nr:GNAT family N-acetyltransferase [Acidimicrobiales bacterium]
MPPVAVDAEICHALLIDGTPVHIRPITPEDDERLVAFHNELSPESLYMRFFSAHPRLQPAEVQRFTHVDGRDRMALVATGHDRIIGVARFDRLPDAPDAAEVAFVVADDYQGRGLGTLLLEHLSACARSRGITSFQAETLVHNAAMQDVFRHAGFAVHSSLSGGVVEVRMDIRPTEAFVAAVDRRDEKSEVNSVLHLLRPRTVAVIGAGTGRGGIGHEVFRNILEGGFTGTAYPVRRGGGEVAGHRAYGSILDVPEPVDLAVVAVPAAAVAAVVEECAQKQVRDIVLITAGFAEAGEEGRQAQAAMVGRARERACGSSVPTAWGSSTRPRRCRSTPPSRRSPPTPAGSLSPPSRAGSGSPCSRRPAAATSASPAS